MINDCVAIRIRCFQRGINGNIFFCYQCGSFSCRRKIQRIQHIDRTKERLFIFRSLRQKTKDCRFPFRRRNKAERLQHFSCNHISFHNRFCSKLQNTVRIIRQRLHLNSRKVRISQQIRKILFSKRYRINSHTRFDHFKIFLHNRYGRRKYSTVDRHTQTKHPKNQKSEKSDFLHISLKSFLLFDMDIFPTLVFFMQKLDNTAQK